MATSWWDEVHWRLWRVENRSDLHTIIDSARRMAREVIAPQLAAGARFGCEWTAQKQRILASMDANGLTSILSSANQGIAMPLSVATWELAWVDGGAATLSLSGSLAQMPIRDFGTKEQQDRYLGSAGRRHAALCLTEPVPGAGTDAMFLTGSFRVAEWIPGSEPMLEIHKRGRFISHMDFADFAVATVQGCGDRARGSCLLILEPGDTGDFDRGSHVRKLGHQLASTTNPAFVLRVPASRIIGGYATVDGVVVPNFDHLRLLEPAFRRTRSIMSLMTASKLLSIVKPLVNPPSQVTGKSELWQPMVDLWATGEAAASLGFSAARLSDQFDSSASYANAKINEAAFFASAAKLFSTSSAAIMLPHAAALESCGPIDSAPDSVHAKLMDAQLEALYLGPEALQRRIISAAMIDGEFLQEFQAWTEAMSQLAKSLPHTGIRSLAAGMRLWHWTLLQLQQQTDSHGSRLYCDARQGVTFSMADALCGLLAARSLTLDVLVLEKSGSQRTATAFVSSLFFDLSAIASIRAAGLVGQISAALLFGYDGRFPVSAAVKSTFDDLRTKLNMSLYGAMEARDRATRFFHPKDES